MGKIVGVGWELVTCEFAVETGDKEVNIPEIELEVDRVFPFIVVEYPGEIVELPVDPDKLVVEENIDTKELAVLEICVWENEVVSPDTVKMPCELVDVSSVETYGFGWTVESIMFCGLAVFTAELNDWRIDDVVVW